MIAWRLTKRKYDSPEAILSGEGAKQGGGRWNEPGLPLVYASENPSLAILENLARLSTEDEFPKRYVIVSVDIPDDAPLESVPLHRLPHDWRSFYNPECIRIGSDWIRAASHLVLRAPAAVNPLDANILLNPAHPDIKRCRVGRPVDVAFDPRLISLIRI